MNNDALKELIEAGIIDQNKADQIASYFAKKTEEKPSRIFLVFAILGAILIGVGIFSIMAFNWSSFSLTTKTIVAFTPLVIAQGLCLYTLLKKAKDPIWFESLSTILAFTFGGALILISELYPVRAYEENYILIWLTLILPVIYIMRSSMASLMCIVGMMIYTLNINGTNWNAAHYFFIPLYIGVVPHYYGLLKNRPSSNFTLAHHVFFWLSLLACICSLSNAFGNLIPMTFLFMGNLTLILSHQKLFLRKPQDQKNDLLFYLSILGIFIAVTFYSFYDNWNNNSFRKFNYFNQPIFYSILILAVISICVIIKERFSNIKSNPLFYVFIPALIALLIGKSSPLLFVIIFNVLGFLMGLFFILEGNKKNHLGILNVGLIMVLTLIIFRSMDLDINEAWKGVIFVFLGLGFFVANFIMIRKRKTI